MILQDFDTFNVKVLQIINYNGPHHLILAIMARLYKHPYRQLLQESPTPPPNKIASIHKDAGIDC